MSQVYTSILRPVIAYTFLLGYFDLSVFQNRHCDEKKSSMFIYLFTCLFVYLIFVYSIDFIQPIPYSISQPPATNF